jgi:PTS system N-acetylglucosamine-specific IIC component
MSASTADRSTTRGSGGMDRALGALQSVGRSLMLPIAVLPAAALLLRLGQDDLLGAAVDGRRRAGLSSTTCRCSSPWASRWG